MHDLKAEFGFCKEYVRDLKIEIAEDKDMTITSDSDTEENGGLCVFDKKNGIYEIRIEKKLLDDRIPVAFLRSLIMHELLHTVKRCMNHGKTFRKNAQKIKDSSRGEYNPLAGVDWEYVINPELEIAAVYECECGLAHYIVKGSSTINAISEKKCVCPCCRKIMNKNNIKYDSDMHIFSKYNA